MNCAAVLLMPTPPDEVLCHPTDRDFESVASLPRFARWRVHEPGRGVYSAKRSRDGNKGLEVGRSIPAQARLQRHVEETHELLRVSIRRLRLAMSVVTVAVGALRYQNADCDEDVACVLERCACDRMDIEIEKLQSQLDRLDGLRGPGQPWAERRR